MLRDEVIIVVIIQEIIENLSNDTISKKAGSCDSALII